MKPTKTHKTGARKTRKEPISRTASERPRHVNNPTAHAPPAQEAREDTRIEQPPPIEAAAEPRPEAATGATPEMKAAPRAEERNDPTIGVRVEPRPEARSGTETKSEGSGGARGDRGHVHDILKGFTTVMLVTMEGQGEGGAKLRARPMNVAKLGDDCALTFMTAVDTAKVEESKRHDMAHVIAQGKTMYVSLRGHVEVVRDRARIDEVWKATDKVFFPRGKDDPSLCLLVFHPEEAELWDMSGLKGLSFLFTAAKSLLTGTGPYGRDEDQHNRVDLRPQE